MKKYTIIWLAAAFFSVGCSKQNAFLDAKPNEALGTPSTLNDLLLLLNSDAIFNTNDPGLGELSTDDFYAPASAWPRLADIERNSYTWAVTIYDAGQSVWDWNGPYQQVYYANTILESLAKISVPAAQQATADRIRGSALFYRSIAFYNLVQTFAMPYDSSAAATELGIPLRLSSDLNIPSVRASEKDCYNQIIEDLQTALPLLPSTSSYLTEPSAAATDGLLARVYLAKGDYTDAMHSASACLQINSTLVDYNTLQPGQYSLSIGFLAEDIYHTVSQPYVLTYPNYKSVTDSTLYALYAPNDLRKTVFFVLNNGLPYFRGTYDFQQYDYSGIAVDEIYLIRSECNARLGNTAPAMRDLNTLLTARWLTGTFMPLTAASADDALALILRERRKELLYRGLRWTDLRRLNKDQRFAVQLTRVVNGVTYTLPPNDPRYALPIPDNEIEFSGISQNPR